jgi:hypothetical protein
MVVQKNMMSDDEVYAASWVWSLPFFSGDADGGTLDNFFDDADVVGGDLHEEPNLEEGAEEEMVASVPYVMGKEPAVAEGHENAPVPSPLADLLTVGEFTDLAATDIFQAPDFDLRQLSSNGRKKMTQQDLLLFLAATSRSDFAIDSTGLRKQRKKKTKASRILKVEADTSDEDDNGPPPGILALLSDDGGSSSESDKSDHLEQLI